MLVDYGKTIISDGAIQSIDIRQGTKEGTEIIEMNAMLVASQLY